MRYGDDEFRGKLVVEVVRTGEHRLQGGSELLEGENMETGDVVLIREREHLRVALKRVAWVIATGRGDSEHGVRVVEGVEVVHHQLDSERRVVFELDLALRCLFELQVRIVEALEVAGVQGGDRTVDFEGGLAADDLEVARGV